MPRITFSDIRNHSGAPAGGLNYLAMDVVYLRHDARQGMFVKPGDYWVARADNRRILGSLEHPKDLLDKPTSREWFAWPVADAFRGAHFDDSGIWDEVPDDLSRSPRKGWTAIGGFTNRDETTECLLSYLYREQSPAMGFSHHWRVRCEARLHELVSTRRKMSAGPFLTEPVRNEWGYDDHIVPAGARPLRFDNLVKGS